MNYPFRNLVFEGGGVKGIAYAGVMEVFEDEGILPNIIRAGGTSAGCINAVLFAAGMDAGATRKEMDSLDFNDFKDDSKGVLRDMKRLKDKYGWYKGSEFKEWIGDILKRRVGSRHVTFEGLHEATGKELYVYATNLSTHFGEVYSPKHTPRMRVTDAARRSMSIPLFFRAVRDDREDVFVDGGVLNNYPVKIFDREKYVENIQHRLDRPYYVEHNEALAITHPDSSPYVYNKETLGFRLDSGTEIGVFRDGAEPKHNDIDNFLDYTMELIKTIMAAQDNQHLHSDDWHRTVYVDTRGVGTIDFDLSDAKKEELIESGRDCARKYLRWFNETNNDPAINHPEN